MKKEGIPFDGFGSVVEMLRRSDGAFREKILSGIRRRDPHLARRLEAHLQPAQTQAQSQAQSREDNRALLERSQRSAHTRNYGH
jgi:hypothetical protein